jgi:hypothetical protein
MATKNVSNSMGVMFHYFNEPLLADSKWVISELK